MIHSYSVQSTSWVLAPRPLLALACGSASMRRIFFSKVASDAARLMVVVVFPTPPFWFAKAIIFPIVKYDTLLLGCLYEYLPDEFALQKYIFYVRNRRIKPFFVLLQAKECDFYEKYEAINTYFQ